MVVRLGPRVLSFYRLWPCYVMMAILLSKDGEAFVTKPNWLGCVTLILLFNTGVFKLF